MGRFIVFAVIAVALTSCSPIISGPEKGSAPKSAHEDATGHAQLRSVLEGAARLEYTIHWHNSLDDSDWRLGPVIIDDEAQVDRIRSALRSSLDQVTFSKDPFSETLYGTFAHIVVLPSRSRSHTARSMRLSTHASLEFFADEKWKGQLRNQAFYDELLRLALESTEDDPRLRIQTKAPRKRSSRTQKA